MKQHLHELSMGNHWESTQSILPHAEFRCDEAKIEESGSCRESNQDTSGLKHESVEHLLALDNTFAITVLESLHTAIGANTL